MKMKSKGKYEVRCRYCKHQEQMSLYCIAQLASGNDMVFTCGECGVETVLRSEKFN